MSNSHRRRRVPPEISALERGGVRFREVRAAKLLGEPQQSGYLVAEESATGNRLWLLQIYPINYVPGKEQDVQEVYFVRLEWLDAENAILVEDELHRSYRIDIATRAVTPLH